jgi:hypothetical protein
MSDEKREELADDTAEDLQLDDEAAKGVTGGFRGKLGDIKGESLDDKHKDEIEI